MERRKLSVQNCRMLGGGDTSSVYALNEDRAVKVYREEIPMEQIEKEQRCAAFVYAKGLPSANVYDIVECDGRYGLVFENVSAETLAQRIAGQPEKQAEYIEKYVCLFKRIHQVRAETEELPAAKEIYRSRIRRLEKWLLPEDVARIESWTAQIPDSGCLLHGDYHLKNIMVRGEELVLIDVDGISCGHPIFELADMYLSHILSGKRSPEYARRLLGIGYGQLLEVWEGFLHGYLGTRGEEAIAELLRQVEILAEIKLMSKLPAVEMPEELLRQKIVELKETVFAHMDAVGNEVSVSFGEDGYSGREEKIP